MKDKAWVFVFPPFLVAGLVAFHFWPVQFLLITTAGMIVRLGIDSFVRRRRRNGPLPTG